MNKKAFTLLEILCVVVILSVLAAVLMPVFARAKLESKAAASKLSLRGFWQGLMLYQSDNDGQQEFGSPESMGLPPAGPSWFEFVNRYTGDYSYSWQTKRKFLPCGIQQEGELRGIGILYMASNLSTWANDAAKYQQDTVVMIDKNCNLPGVRPLCQFCKKRSIGVTLGGTIKDRMNGNWPVLDQRFYQ